MEDSGSGRKGEGVGEREGMTGSEIPEEKEGLPVLKPAGSVKGELGDEVAAGASAPYDLRGHQSAL